MKDLRDTDGRIAELKERRIAAEDDLMRVDIRAPQRGFVNHLAVHTVGGVVAARETLMEIVPVADQLLVEAKIAPSEIDRIRPGSEATVRILAGNRRKTPDIQARLDYVAADLTRDARTQQAYYVVRASLEEKETQRLGELALKPGMPAEMFIKTEDRSPLRYLLQPLEEQASRAFRER